MSKFHKPQLFAPNYKKTATSAFWNHFHRTTTIWPLVTQNCNFCTKLQLFALYFTIQSCSFVLLGHK
uniref:Uncharacterized protein n=1 Tax=Arundo donax TaxID=35708 RepID=A0A0A9A3U7_ARUDO